MNTHTVEELYRLAQQGNTEALTRLGICYKNGTGTAVDHSAAAQCFYSAANAGNAEAQYQLGICYEEGIGLEQDLSAAGYWVSGSGKAVLRSCPGWKSAGSIWTGKLLCRGPRSGKG